MVLYGMVKTIRLMEDVHNRLSEIKKELESRASSSVGTRVSISFEEVIKKLCEVYDRND